MNNNISSLNCGCTGRNSLNISILTAPDNPELHDLETRLAALESLGLSWESIDQHIIDGVNELTKPDSQIPFLRVQDDMYTVNYNYLDYEFADEYFRKNQPIVSGACSAVKCGNLIGRNFDWYDDADEPAFVINTPAVNGRNAVLGVARLTGLTNAKIESGDAESRLMLKALPFALLDGVNDNGLFAECNVCPRDKGQNTYSVPEVELRHELSALMVVRFVLDYCATASEAVNTLKNYCSVYIPQNLIDMGYDLHFMIADKNTSYAVEIVDNHLVINESEVLTNFHVDGVDFLADGTVYTNADAVDGNLATSLGITQYGAGLERFNVLVSNKASVSSSAQIRALMEQVYYTKTYAEPTVWYSEFVNHGVHNVTVDTLPNDTNMQYVINAAKAPGARKWRTNHSAVYNLDSKTLRLVVDEMGNDMIFKLGNAQNEGLTPDIQDYINDSVSAAIAEAIAQGVPAEIKRQSLTQEQYDELVEQGLVDENKIYLTD